jgi:hypothetical protein
MSASSPATSWQNDRLFVAEKARQTAAFLAELVASAAGDAHGRSPQLHHSETNNE